MSTTGPTSARRLSRISEILHLVARHGFGYLLERRTVRDVLGRGAADVNLDAPVDHGSRGRRLRELLEDLGPTFVKFGQLLSTRPDVVPPDVLAELRGLQDHVRPVGLDEVRAVVEAELGAPVEDVFASFDPEPLAAASIGQVHRARLPGGEEVVVKVQRPRAEQQVASDLALLRQLAGLARDHVRRLDFLDAPELVDEFARSITEELDYRHEARNVEAFRRAFEGDERLWVPRVHWDFTSQRVLTLELVPGPKLSDLGPDDLTLGERQALARRLVEVWLEMVFARGLFHGDPHPGNLLVCPDGRLGLIDFGIVGRLSQEDVRRLGRLVVDLGAGRVDALPRHLGALGVRYPPGREVEVRAALADLYYRYAERSLSEIDGVALAHDILAVIHGQGLRLPTRFVLLDKTFITVGAVAQGLDPDLAVLEVLQPYARRLALDPNLVADRARGMAVSAAAMLDLPQEVQATLVRLGTGQIEVGVRHEALDRPLRQLDAMANRVVLAVVAVATLLASAVVAGTDRGPHVLGLHVLGLVGLLASGALTTGLVLRVLRSGRL